MKRDGKRRLLAAVNYHRVDRTIDPSNFWVRNIHTDIDNTGCSDALYQRTLPVSHRDEVHVTGPCTTNVELNIKTSPMLVRLVCLESTRILLATGRSSPSQAEVLYRHTDITRHIYIHRAVWDRVGPFMGWVGLSEDLTA